MTLPRSGERTVVAAAEVTLTVSALHRNAQATKQSIRYIYIYIRCLTGNLAKCQTSILMKFDFMHIGFVNIVDEFRKYQLGSINSFKG